MARIMNETLTYAGQLVVRRCWCGIRHAIPSELSYAADYDPHLQVYCPVGHRWVSTTNETRQVEQLRRQVANKDEDLRAERSSHSITKGKLTKARNRAAKGLCPCCPRSFVDVARHVATKHPEFKP